MNAERSASQPKADTQRPGKTAVYADAAARAIVDAVEAGFDQYRREFEALSAGAPERFEQADWRGMQTACMQRVDLYELSVSSTTGQVQQQTRGSYLSTQSWQQAKPLYAARAALRTDGELAETFFNSIYCRIFRHQAIDDSKLFVKSALPADWVPPQTGITHRYELKGNLPAMINRMLEDYRFQVPYEYQRRDVRNITRYLKEHPLPGIGLNQGAYMDILKSVFYRNKGAYLVGKVSSRNGQYQWPLVLPVLNNEQGGVYVDALIVDPEDVSIIFSFTRSYFMVSAPVPSEYVRFLHSMLPNKKVHEIYSSIGFFKHGKTEFYRDFLDHMERTEDKFVPAPGVKGMVMTVFMLPSLDSVFKIIKDRFHPSKNMTRETVKAKYRLVKRHDRAGRMADTQEFSNFIFDRNRFSDEVLKELLDVAAQTVELRGDKVLIKHLWVERRMIPLNIYIDQATGEALRDAISEYGNAIRQLAAANIFPGDMLFKNFGVTRHKRVVFYDYDEICYLSECNFRKIPAPRYPDDELASEPWYSIAPNDVFPEEFSTFLTGPGRSEVAEIFHAMHSEIFDAAYWQSLQQAINEGEVVDVFPYRRKKRFCQRSAKPK